MKKLLATALLLLVAAAGLQAQVKIESQPRNNLWWWGLKDVSTGKWVAEPIYQHIDNSSTGFHTVKLNNKWGMLNTRGEEVIPVVYDGIETLHADLKMAAVKHEGKWALIDYNRNYLTNFEFTRIWTVPSGTRFTWWKEDASGGGTEGYRVYSNPELMAHRDKILKQYAEREAQKAEQERQAAERARKEKELASFTTYAKAYVEPRIDAWQRKGEFETTAEYARRVTGISRADQIARYTDEARAQFLKEHAELHDNLSVTLGTYDADNEVFLVSAPAFGDMLLAVPRAEAPAFKQNFASYTLTDPHYFVDSDRIGLSAFTLTSPGGKSYAYSNQNALRYNTYEVDYGAFDFAPVEIAPAASASSGGKGSYQSVQIQTQAGTYAKPTLKILYPENGATYSTPELVLRYEARTGDGGTPAIEVWINGKPYTPPAETAKGVRRVGEEILLTLPQEPGECYIMMQAMDDHGEVKLEKLTLVYAGEKPKPSLHVLAVGVSEYNQPELRLKQAAKDAGDFVRTVRTADATAYNRVEDPLLLTDKGATQKEIVRALRSVELAANQDDVVLLFFSGHGDKEGNETYFLPVDAEKSDLFSTAVDFDLIEKATQRLVSKKCKVVVFMDACYSGTLGSKSGSDHITLANPGVIGFYSSTRDQQSKESEQWANGIFTKALLDGLQGGAVNERGEITVYRLQSYISEEVRRGTEGRQQPIIENPLGDLVLFRAAP